MAWFKDWFDTPYYHLLYGERDEKEAGLFILKLLQFLKPDEKAVFLDLACGKGRHSIDIASHGYSVFGVDLSTRSIDEAKAKGLDNPHFELHDMRSSYKPDFFDYILNLFTSFGYFKDGEDNIKTLNAVHKDLKQNGIFVQDYFNTSKIRKMIVPVEHKLKGGIDFEIRKKMNEKCIIKNIRFKDHGCQYNFEEKVSLFELSDFEEMYNTCGFKLLHVYGNYQMQEYDPNTSDRLILISGKL